jgi:hypothetical protein
VTAIGSHIVPWCRLADRGDAVSAPTQQACATEVGKVGVDAALSLTGLEGGLRWPVNQPMGSKMMPRLIISAAKVAYYPADVA